MRPFLALVAIAVGCGPGPEPELSCAADPHDWLEGQMVPGWYYGLTYTVRAGGGETFDFNPVGSPIVRREGHITDGDIAFTDTYADGYPLTDADVDGSGTVAADGDLDVTLTVTAHDVLGRTLTTEITQVRSGCDETYSVTDDASAMDWNLHLASDARVERSGTGTWLGGPLEREDVLGPDGEVQYEQFWDVGAVEEDAYGTLHRDGTAVRYAHQDLTGQYEGYVQYDFRFDGGRFEDWATYDRDWAMQATGYNNVAYDTSFTGIYAYRDSLGFWYECTLTGLADGTCTYDCGIYGSGAC